MGMKIAMLLPLAGKARDPNLKPMVDLLIKDVEQTKSKDTEVVVYFLNSGFTQLEDFLYNHFVFRNEREIYEAVIQIEKEGYDAVMLICFYDPILQEARQALNIPVIGPAQTSMLMANMMAGNFALVSLSDLAIPHYMGLVEKYNMKNKMVCVKSIATPYEEQMAALVDAKEEIEEFVRVSRECIAEGAELIIPACMALSPAVSMAPGCEKEYPEGIKEVDGAAVIDILAVMVKVAEAMVSLKRAGRPWISRKCTYAKASEECEKRVLSYFQYQSSGCWHF